MQVSVHVPSLHKKYRQASQDVKQNAVEFATKVCFSRWLRGNSVTDVMYEGEIVQHVALQKLMTCLVYRYTYVDRH